MQKKALFLGSPSSVVHFFTQFLKNICETPAWCIFLLKQANHLDETLKNTFGAKNSTQQSKLYLLPTTYCLLPTTYYLLPTTY